jgi:hypothetical protein
MSTQPPIVQFVPYIDQGIMLASKTVAMDGLDAHLHDVAKELARMHVALFDKFLIVTSANDSVHSKGSKHYIGKALDIRSHDKSELEQALWAIVLSFVCPPHGVGVFDERALPGGAHWHLEVA